MSIANKNIKKYQKKFGANLKKISEANGLSQSELAAICDLEKTSNSRIENGPLIIQQMN
ncbi:helix-turn-helix domain-containing protein [Algibacter sp.]|nr:helix-turn-helix domain-containing protein [Algibacter sp.]